MLSLLMKSDLLWANSPSRTNAPIAVPLLKICLLSTNSFWFCCNSCDSLTICKANAKLLSLSIDCFITFRCSFFFYHFECKFECLFFVVFFFNGFQNFVGQPKGKEFFFRLVKNFGEGHNVFLPEKAVATLHFAEH